MVIMAIGVVIVLGGAVLVWQAREAQEPVTQGGEIGGGDDGGGGGSIAPYHSGVRGSVLLGPTCPVERNPPDPGCAPRPYQTMVNVYRSGNTHVFANVKTAADGSFEFSLPPGEYTLSADGSSSITPARLTVGPKRPSAQNQLLQP